MSRRAASARSFGRIGTSFGSPSSILFSSTLYLQGIREGDRGRQAAEAFTLSPIQRLKNRRRWSLALLDFTKTSYSSDQEMRFSSVLRPESCHFHSHFPRLFTDQDGY